MERFMVKGNGPEWLRTSFRDGRGEVFLPCGVFASEQIAFLFLAHDGVPVVRDAGHVYAPTSWLTREYPKHAEAINIIAAKLRAA